MEDETLVKKARSKVLRYLTYRARSIKEVADYLEQKGFNGNVANLVIEEMKKYGYLDDHKFASDFVNARKMSGFGCKRVRFELQMKGVDKEIIEEQISEIFDSGEDLFRISELLARREPHNGQIDRRWLNRQAGFLKRRGFQDDLILKSLKNYDLSQ